MTPLIYIHLCEHVQSKRKAALKFQTFPHNNGHYSYRSVCLLKS